MKTYALSAAATLCALLALPSQANAQERSEAWTRECESHTQLKRLAYHYLTGRSIPFNTNPRDPESVELITDVSKKLEINKSPVRHTFIGTRAYHAGAVSFPFVANSSYARFSYTGSGPTEYLYVCHYALKTTAKSWASFEPSDLKALMGRVLIRSRANEEVSVRLGGTKPPAGYRTSTIVAVLAHPPGGATNKLTLQLRTLPR